MTIEKISNKRANDILKSFEDLEVYNSAISTLKSYILVDNKDNDEVIKLYKDKIKELKEVASNLEEEFRKNMTKIQNKFSRSNCIVKLTNNWYSVLVIDELGSKSLMVVPIYDGSVACKKLETYNPSAVGFMTKEELTILISKEELTSGLINQYKTGISVRAHDELLKDFLDSMSLSDTSEYNITKHAISRWRERKEFETKDINEEAVVENIMESFNNSKKVWQNVEDSPNIFDDTIEGDIIEYYYNEEDNNMFVVSPVRKNIITVYEEDFGFCKDINVKTTLMQLEHLNTQYDIGKEKDKQLKFDYMIANAELQAIMGEKKQLEARLNSLNYTIKVKKEQLSNIDSLRNSMQRGIKKELDLLFKKYK